MKVIQINSTLKSGSTGKIAYAIKQYLMDKQDECLIVFGYGDKSDPTGFSLNSYLGNHLHSFFSRTLCMQGRLSVLATLKAIRYIKKETPDIIHLHNIHGHYLNYPLLFQFLKKTNIPVVWTLHDCWAYTGKCAHYTTAKCMKWKTGCFSCPNLKTYPDSVCDASRRNYYLKKKYFTSIDSLHIVTVSDWLKKQVQQSYLGNKEITRINNGVDVDLFKPITLNSMRRKLSICEGTFVVLGVSNVWKSNKGYDKFLAAAEALKDECEFVMVGLTQEQIKDIPENIHGIQRTESQAELVELYACSDVLLNTSTEETFGMVSIESMACGTPIIVSNETACSEVVVNERIGTAIDMNQINQITEAILNIKAHGKRYYSDACRKAAAESFSLRAMQENYYDLYMKITQSNFCDNGI